MYLIQRVLSLAGFTSRYFLAKCALYEALIKVRRDQLADIYAIPVALSYVGAAPGSAVHFMQHCASVFVEGDQPSVNFRTLHAGFINPQYFL